MPLQVLHEDDAICVLDKAPGVLVHPTGRHVYDTIMNALFLRYRKSGEADKGVQPHVVHRLDRDTTGVLVVAKSEEVKQALQDEFESRRPQKHYVALVEGVIADDTGTVDAPIGRDEEAAIRLKMRIDPNGARAVTDLSLIHI